MDEYDVMDMQRTLRLLLKYDFMDMQRTLRLLLNSFIFNLTFFDNC